MNVVTIGSVLVHAELKSYEFDYYFSYSQKVKRQRKTKFTVKVSFIWISIWGGGAVEIEIPRKLQQF